MGRPPRNAGMARAAAQCVAASLALKHKPRRTVYIRGPEHDNYEDVMRLRCPLTAVLTIFPPTARHDVRATVAFSSSDAPLLARPCHCP
jgi:hypothetical protein